MQLSFSWHSPDYYRTYLTIYIQRMFKKCHILLKYITQVVEIYQKIILTIVTLITKKEQILNSGDLVCMYKSKKGK